MKKLSNTEAELKKKALLIKKSVFHQDRSPISIDDVDILQGLSW